MQHTEHSHLSLTELAVAIEAHPCFWDTSPAAIFMKELLARNIHLMDTVEDIEDSGSDSEQEIENLKQKVNDLEQAVKDLTGV